MNLILALLSFCMIPRVAMAQSDITKYYLTNYGFDTDFDYPASTNAIVTQEILDIPGWTANLSADYTIAGIYEFGFSGKFNEGTVPATGYNGEPGGALALSTGWEQTFCYYQTVTLPKGTYTIKVPTYNGKTATGGVSKLSWIPNSGSIISSTVKSYPGKQWTVDEITFTLTSSKTGKIQIGYQAAAGGSANSANLLIDYVQLLGENMAVSKTSLRTAIKSANTLYGDGTGAYATELKAAIDAAQATYDKEGVTMPEILEASYNLQEAVDTYNLKNASENKPVVRTELITNPSFEVNGASGWTVKNMNAQSNSVFSRKSGTYYMETWVDIGQKIGEASIEQTLKNLPQGKYRLQANALHIQQSGSNSTTNAGEAQTGAFLFAGVSKTEVSAMKQYSVLFSVVDEKADVTIGLKTEKPTGNYLCVDNFTLQYVGEITNESYVQEVEKLVEQAQQLQDKGVQNSAAETLKAAIAAAQTAMKGTGTDDEGNTIYDLDALNTARKQLTEAIETAEASRTLYDNLQARIDYAQKVIGWWKDTERKAAAVATLTEAVETARQKATDYTLSDNELTAAVTTLNTSISTVDKKIYCSTSACGTDADLKKPTSQWCYDRSVQSKHWILFWEAGYGTSTPSAVEGILNTADRIFEFYADSLKFITINQGKSKTDTYKMIIRLRHTTDWEASGSGIDNIIGLLTLSNGAHTSRSGQTVAHEIGHCFQYQTHCDNNNWNGWMYNWGNSTLNVFWEMCAQWQAYKFYPGMQFDNEWLYNTLNGLHRHPLAVDLRYNNYFIQDYMCHKHGMDIIAQLWNKSQSPEDPFQAYMRLTMSGTTAKKLNQLGDEMWEYGARMTTFDMDHLRQRGSSAINKRNQPTLNDAGDGFWRPAPAYCIENFGNNAIRLNAPETAKTVYVEFVGEAGMEGYTNYNKIRAGWRYGFVALLKDGTRVYSDISTATNTNATGVAEFECPDNCSYLWLVVSGAPTSYWTRDWLSWESESTAEQWPYRVKLFQTNIYGKANNNTYPSGISDIAADESALTDNNVYSITGQIVRHGSTSLDGLPHGIYIVNGKKVLVR